MNLDGSGAAPDHPRQVRRLRRPLPAGRAHRVPFHPPRPGAAGRAAPAPRAPSPGRTCRIATCAAAAARSGRWRSTRCTPMNADGTRPRAPFRPSRCSSGRRKSRTTAASSTRAGITLTATTCPTWACGRSNPDGSNARIGLQELHPRARIASSRRSPSPARTRSSSPRSAHHAQTMGSLVLLDPSAGTEGAPPMTRLTPEVRFPEIEGWPITSYANPWPLSERFHLVAWGAEGYLVQGKPGWDRWHAVQRPQQRHGALSLRRRHAQPRTALGATRTSPAATRFPCARASGRPSLPASSPPTPREGRFLLADVYQGLDRRAARRDQVAAPRGRSGQDASDDELPQHGGHPRRPGQVRARHRAGRGRRVGLFPRPGGRDRVLPGARCAGRARCRPCAA